MSLIFWNNDMSVGILSIDNQHKKLCELLNNLYDASSQGKGEEVVGNTLLNLINYTVEHFQYEEKFFRETNYPEAKEHILEHERLTERVQTIYKKYQEDKASTVSQEVLSFLVDWLMKHTTGTDKRYTAHFLAAGIR